MPKLCHPIWTGLGSASCAALLGNQFHKWGPWLHIPCLIALCVLHPLNPMQVQDVTKKVQFYVVSNDTCDHYWPASAVVNDSAVVQILLWAQGFITGQALVKTGWIVPSHSHLALLLHQLWNIWLSGNASHTTASLPSIQQYTFSGFRWQCMSRDGYVSKLKKQANLPDIMRIYGYPPNATPPPENRSLIRPY